jgi:signal transduction histidine kinase
LDKAEKAGGINRRIYSEQKMREKTIGKRLQGYNLRIISLFILFIFISASLHGAERLDLSAPEKKAKSLVMLAHEFVKKNSGNMELIQETIENDPRFKNEEHRLYIFMHAYSQEKRKAVCVAHGIRPELIGKNMWGLRTPNGRLLFQEEIKLINKQDEVWLEYDWLNPYTQKIGRKRSFFKKVNLDDGRTAWIGCGFWKK